MGMARDLSVCPLMTQSRHYLFLSPAGGQPDSHALMIFVYAIALAAPSSCG